MGCKITCFKATVNPISINKRIVEDILERSRIEEQRTVKLLLLGTSESGKSTFAKQIRLIQNEGFSMEERKIYMCLIHTNALRAAMDLMQKMTESGMTFSDTQRLKDQKLIEEKGSCVVEACERLSPDLGAAMKRIWEDSNVQEFFRQPGRFLLPESTAYYLSAIDRISDAKYLPTDQDIVRSRVATTGVIETTFQYRNLFFRLCDVGGQRSERRKWIHLFDNVTAILYTVAMSDYDLYIPEDENMNRLRESVTLFSSIINYNLFTTTGVILFLNKLDIFREKLTSSPLENSYPQYTGNTVAEAITFIKNLFLINSSEKREIYAHCTIATDVRNVELVFRSSINVILTNNMKKLGLA